MNLHPVLVHFPIALLIVYCVMELVRFKFLMRQPYWFYAKAIFLTLGGLGALAALFTGDDARNAVRMGEFHPAIVNFKEVVSMHENFADISVAIFGILALSYLIVWLNHENIGRFFTQNSLLQKIWQLKVQFAHFFVETNFVILLALIGLICISITGGLGGVIVYGPKVDPFFGVIYKMLFPTS